MFLQLLLLLASACAFAFSQIALEAPQSVALEQTKGICAIPSAKRWITTDRIEEDFESAKRSDSVDNQPIESTPLARNQSRNGPQTAPNAHEVLIFHRHLPLCAFANASTRPPPPSHRHLPQNYIKMAGAAAGSRVADVLHKTVTTGLIVITIAGVADVVRGFGVLTKRNIDRRSGGADNATPGAGGASSHEE